MKTRSTFRKKCRLPSSITHYYETEKQKFKLFFSSAKWQTEKMSLPQFKVNFSPRRSSEAADVWRGKIQTVCVLAICFLLVITAFRQTSVAQTLEAKITIQSPDAGKILVEGKTFNPRKRWTFVNFYANAENLAARIENLKFYDEMNREAAFTKQSAEIFETQTEVNRFSYELKLNFPADPAQAAHISWLKQERGLLHLGDVLPDLAGKTKAKISFSLPVAWKIATSADKLGENLYQTEDFENAIFLLGDFQENLIKAGKSEIKLARIGDWSFTVAETLDNAAEIFAAHERVVGSLPVNKIQIILLPFPQNFGGERWEAETRGSTLILFSAANAFKSRALSRLQEQLRHELFHLWLPNALNLSGDYAWFYEGFTIYQALKTGVRLKQIRFVDFLDTMSRAYDAARRSPHNKSLGLIEASRLRWSINSSEFVYAKGMVAAFLCDLALLGESKKTLDSVFSELFHRHQRQNGFNANEVIVNFLKNTPELKTVIEKYVETAGEFDWTSEITAAGLRDNQRGSFTFLAAKEKLSGRQRKLLEKLGYNAELKGL